MSSTQKVVVNHKIHKNTTALQPNQKGKKKRIETLQT